MDFGVEAGKQALEVGKAVNELFMDQDDEEDNEVLASPLDSDEQKQRTQRDRAKVVQSILRVNQLAQAARQQVASSYEGQDQSFSE